MSIYLLGIILSIVIYIVIGILAGRKVKDIDDYYVAGRRAPTILVTGSLIASYLSSGAFIGDPGEIYSGLFIAILMGTVIQSAGFVWGSCLFGRYIRRSQALTLPEYFGKRFCSKPLRILSALIMLVSVAAYMLSTLQGISTLMQGITGLEYNISVILAWVSFTIFTIYSGSMGVLITDTVMFLVFLVAAIITLPFVVESAGGWMPAIHALSVSETCPGIISWHGNLSYLYPTGAENLGWSVVFGLVWMLVVMVSPWQTSRYLMAKDEHTVLRSSVWSTGGVILTLFCVYFTVPFIQHINPDLIPTSSMIWAAMNLTPLLIGVVLLAGILAAGISSASTHLSLIGFSMTNDLFPAVHSTNSKQLALSRITMFVVSIVVLLIALLNPPNIFVIVFFGGSVIAAAWGPVAFASVWSRKLSKAGAFLGMLLGFLVCVAVKIISSHVPFTWPFYLDALILGVIASIAGMILGSKLRPVSEEETSTRNSLFVVPSSETDPSACRKTHRLGYLVIGFGVAMMLFLLFAWAFPTMGLY